MSLVYEWYFDKAAAKFGDLTTTDWTKRMALNNLAVTTLFSGDIAQAINYLEKAVLAGSGRIHCCSSCW